MSKTTDIGAEKGKRESLPELTTVKEKPAKRAEIEGLLREAEALIYNVGCGRFPDKTRPPNLSDKSYRRRIK